MKRRRDVLLSGLVLGAAVLLSSCCKKDEAIPIPPEPTATVAPTVPESPPTAVPIDASAPIPPTATAPTGTAVPRDGGTVRADGGATPTPTTSFPTPVLPSALPLPSGWPPLPTGLPSGLPFPVPPAGSGK